MWTPFNKHQIEYRRQVYKLDSAAAIAVIDDVTN